MTEPREYPRVTKPYPDTAAFYAVRECPTHGEEVEVFYSLDVLVNSFLPRYEDALALGELLNDDLTKAFAEGIRRTLLAITQSRDFLIKEAEMYTSTMDALDVAETPADLFPDL